MSELHEAARHWLATRDENTNTGKLIAALLADNERQNKRAEGWRDQCADAEGQIAQANQHAREWKAIAHAAEARLRELESRK